MISFFYGFHILFSLVLNFGIAFDLMNFVDKNVEDNPERRIRDGIKLLIVLGCFFLMILFQVFLGVSFDLSYNSYDDGDFHGFACFPGTILVYLIFMLFFKFKKVKSTDYYGIINFFVTDYRVLFVVYFAIIVFSMLLTETINWVVYTFRLM